LTERRDRATIKFVEPGVIYRVVDQVPFRPFTIELENGSKIRVDHPERIFFLPDRIKLVRIEVFWDDDSAIFGPSAVTAIRVPAGDGDPSV
jgi:hypothetical protein